MREDFGDYVIDNFVDEYMAGRTPNPCVLCNTHIKWNSLLKRADALDCEFIATGHYAIINEQAGRKFVTKAVDDKKDQSYVLWGLDQACLHRSKFPLGGYTKPEIRQMAYDWGYEELSKKAESFEICFVPDNDYRGFLKRRVDGLAEKVNGGNFLSTKGEILGQHEGYPFYTIGQRKGLKIALGKPMYVTEIQPETNTVILGEMDDLIKNGMSVGGVNVTKIRYKDPGTLSALRNNNIPGQINVEFFANVKGVAPGQSAVFYEGDDVVGGGIIHSGRMN